MAAQTASPIVAAPVPAPLAPALVAKPAISPSPGPGTPGSITTKEWVIPPRPKPGRKPATDTPPTKRKAQNRAAQRAFRERRAARVNELEEQIKSIEDEHDIHVAAFKEQISTLSREVEQCRTEMNWWRDRCHALEKEVSVERTARETLVKEFRSSVPDKSASNSDKAVPLPPRGSARVSRVESNHLHNHSHQLEQEEVPLGCNQCSTSHCQCLEDAFAMPGIEMKDLPQSKLVARHSEPKIKPEPEEMEIDFTTRFAAPHAPEEIHNPVSSPPVDPCGFCQDGTPCICAEMAAQEEQRRRGNNYESNRLAPIQSISQFTPPPSDGDVRSEVTLPSLSQATNPCANGPGTCTQCLSDPRRTLFCKTLAASRSASGTPSGCCGGKGPDGGCCQTRPTKTTTDSAATTPALTLSCTDAFTTLSRHPNFSRASDELASWLPKLHTLPNPKDVGTSSRAAIEVEAASVMGVLRYFDRRFADK
ncbi:hypothetical protein P175DRAFT_0437286 [Aspergillus ochraceoroseus IBT 24754]|uniref:BZIP domain-containing protein n=2 Tax=Aspergillus ochraceoroseus TaxID=138278 RepID=A0A2T5LXJ2_9EURO|nr:uncharacterized protein P175DRAFT_0437286 [Aspergillus ochraceoroseus IBT 24754]KKK18526.1 hypothetical protein AOCH_005655 [Aspergillus ochraceoroseus]PTU21006.1 hypothetical protein P175DRAFT_0437286 [Aspergillus ochraceoroseus IBT 24754]